MRLALAGRRKAGRDRSAFLMLGRYEVLMLGDSINNILAMRSVIESANAY